MTYEKNKALKDIEEINKNITTSLSLVNTRNRGFTSQNILSQLRNLSEAILVFCYNEHTNQNVAIGHDSIHASQEHLVSIDKYNDICNCINGCKRLHLTILKIRWTLKAL